MIEVFKFEIKKLIYNPLLLLMSLGLPILSVIIVGIIQEKISLPNSNIKVFDYCFPGYIILSIFILAGSTVSTIIGNDRIEKRIKQISLSNLGVRKYLSSIIIFNFFVFFIGLLTMMFIAIIFFNLTINFRIIIALLFIPILIFIFVALFFLSFSNLTNTYKNMMTVTFILFYASIFLSGATIPLFVFPDWWKYITYLFPPSLCVFIFTNLTNNISFSNNWFVFIIFAFYFVLFSYLSIKTFKWE